MFVIVEDPKSKDKLWIVSDNWVAETFRPHFKKVKNYDFFIKDNFDVTSFCSSRYCDKNQNVLSRVYNMMVNTLNKEKSLPKFVVILLDVELLNYLDYTGHQMATLLGNWVEWLINGISDMIETKKNYLPKKAKREEEPAIYWNELPLHQNFDQNVARSLYNATLGSVIKTKSQMRLMKIKEIWDGTNDALVVNNRLTADGMAIYWKALDNTFKFNHFKREIFLAKDFLKKHGVRYEIPHRKPEIVPEQWKCQQSHDDETLRMMFQRRRNSDDKMVWHKSPKRSRSHELNPLFSIEDNRRRFSSTSQFKFLLLRPSKKN